MKYSYKWLAEHIADKLPSPEELALTVTMKAFEVEGVERYAATEDHIFDIKVLPDRAHDALSHRGMAREIAALFGLSRKEREVSAVSFDPDVPEVRVSIDGAERCPRYIGVRVDGMTVAPSSESIAEKLAAIGARPINNVVDLTNFILFDLGQPMHAFDAAKVKGGITVRLAKAGETMTTLDNKELTFDGSETVIADDEAVLALASVKGGKKAEVDEKTTSVIFECANFDPTSTRRTSTRHNIKTDASKRYENGITSELAGEAIALALAMTKTIFPNARIGAIADRYEKCEDEKRTIPIAAQRINKLLGTRMNDEDVESVLKRLTWTYEKKDKQFIVGIPVERLDLCIEADLIEEIGRQYGYDRIEPTLPKLSRKGLPHKRLYYANKVRGFLTEKGFAEVYTYSFAKKGEGEIEVMNPVGKDRPMFRDGLEVGIVSALGMNALNAPFLGLNDVQIFEFGNVYSQGKEKMKLGIGICVSSKKRAKILGEEVAVIRKEIFELLGVSSAEGIVTHEGDYQGKKLVVWEEDFDALITKLPEPTAYEPLGKHDANVVYKRFSSFPFIVRDVALWVPSGTSPETIEQIIRDNAGELAVKVYLFDQFEKEDRTSYAFRMVLQSFERTLEDAEANEIYDRVVTALEKAHENWEVRK